MMRFLRLVMILTFCAAAAAGAAQRELTLTDYLGHTWQHELVHQEMEFARGEFYPDRMVLKGPDGAAVPFQLSQVQRYADGSLKSASLWWMADLGPHQSRTWTLTSTAAPRLATDLVVRNKGGKFIEMITDRTGVRIPVSADGPAPPPIAAIRLPDGTWAGEGAWSTEVPPIRLETKLLADGPLFALAELKYDFADGDRYSALVKVISGEPAILLEETFNLGDKNKFQAPTFASERQARLWDWWMQSHARKPSPNNWTFTINRGWKPDQVLFRGKGQDIPWGKEPGIGHITSFMQWGYDEGLYAAVYSKDKPQGNALVVMGVSPGKWIHPNLLNEPPAFVKQWTQTNNVWLVGDAQKRLYLKAPVNMGKRALAFFVLRPGQWAKAEGKPDPFAALNVKFGRNPLDKVKDYVLSWPRRVKNPRIFCKPGDLEAMRKRGGKADSARKASAWLSSHGDVQVAFREVRDWLRAQVMRNLTGWFFAQDMMWGWNMMRVAPVADALLSEEAGLSKEQQDELRTLAAYICYTTVDPDNRPDRIQGFMSGSANQGSSPPIMLGMYAKMIADHPMAQEWMKFSGQFAVWDLDRYVNEAGAPQECQHYAGTTCTFDMTGMAALSDSIDLSEALPKLRALARMRLNTLPPTDPMFGKRTILPMGDTAPEGDVILGFLAVVLRKMDPELSAQCARAWQESGSPTGGFTDLRFLMPTDLPTAPPQRQSMRIDGYGAVLRGGQQAPTEPFVNYYHGSFSWGHYDSDQGSIIFFAKGTPILYDFSSMYYPSIRQWVFHNAITYDNEEPDPPLPCPGRGHPDCFYTGSQWVEHKTEPFTFWEYDFDPLGEGAAASLGDIHGFAATPVADWAMGKQHHKQMKLEPYRYDKPGVALRGRLEAQKKLALKRPFTWTRQVVLVKEDDPMGVNYLVIADDLEGQKELQPNMNLWFMTEPFTLNGTRATAKAQFADIMVDVLVAEPTKFAWVQAEAAHKFGYTMSADFKRLWNRDFEERLRMLRIPQQPGGGFLVVIYPRRPQEPTPRLERLAGKQALKLTLPDQTHYVFLPVKPDTFKESDVTMEGPGGVVELYSDGRVAAAIFGPGVINARGLTLRAKGPASAVSDGKTVQVHGDGEAELAR